MTTTGGVGIEGIHLADIGGDGIKTRGTGDHFGTLATLFSIHCCRQASKESGVVIGCGTEDIPCLIEADSPGVVIKLVEKLDIGSVGFEAENAHAEVVPFAVNFAIEA